MEAYELNTVINRPVEEIFTVLSNLENDLKWRTEWVDARKVSESPIGIGTQYSLAAKSFGSIYYHVMPILQEEVAGKTDDLMS